MALASNLPLQLCIQVTDTPAEPGFGSLVQQHKVVPGRNWMMGSHVDLWMAKDKRTGIDGDLGFFARFIDSPSKTQ